MEDLEEPLYLATASGEVVKLWSLPNVEDLGLHSVRPYSGTVNCTCWSTDNALLATAFGEQIHIAGVKGEQIADLSTEAEQLCLCFSSNSRYLLSGSKHGAVHIWDLKHKTKRKSFVDHKSSILCATFNYNDTVIASGDEDGDVLLHTVMSASVAGPLQTQQTQAVRGVQYSYFKKTLLGTASDDGSMNLWDTNTKQLIKEFKNEHRLPATGICFSPANDMLVCSIGIDKKIVFYDVVGKKSVKSITTDSPLTSVDFLYNGACLAVGSATGKLYLYDLRSGSTPMKTATADKTAIKTVTFQKPPAPKSASSKGLSRKGSDSSINSNSSIKSKDSRGDAPKTSLTHPDADRVDRMKEPSKSKPPVEKPTAKQPVSLFSPLRGGEQDSDSGVIDADIVPMDIMRAEISKKIGNIPEDSRSDRSQPSSAKTSMQLRFADRSKDSDTDISDRDFESLKSRISKAVEDTSKTEERYLNGKTRESDGSQLTAAALFRPSSGNEQSVTTTTGPAAMHPFQIDFIRNMIEDSMEDSRYGFLCCPTSLIYLIVCE
eukprot:gene6018-6717_t